MLWFAFQLTINEIGAIAHWFKQPPGKVELKSKQKVVIGAFSGLGGVRGRRRHFCIPVAFEEYKRAMFESGIRTNVLYEKVAPTGPEAKEWDMGECGEGWKGFDDLYLTIQRGGNGSLVLVFCVWTFHIL